MFTGIVQGICHVVGVDIAPGGRMRLVLQLDELARDVQLGASIAVNGCCLTVAAAADGRVEFDVIPETLALTNLAGLRLGDPVNVERSARMQDEIGGHRVSGHVTGIARVCRISVSGDDYRVRLMAAADWMPCLLHKGFVALDGASLTISAVDARACELEVSLIPETLARTVFGVRQVGEAVNLEVDSTTQAVVETVRRLFADEANRQQLLGAIKP